MNPNKRLNLADFSWGIRSAPLGKVRVAVLGPRARQIMSAASRKRNGKPAVVTLPTLKFMEGKS